MRTTLVLGGPGAGKTHRLLQLMEDEMSRGVAPHSIAFVSFTRKAVNEARDRAMNHFHLKREDLPFFRTLHSLCYRQLGVTRSSVFNDQHVKELERILDVPIGRHFQTDTGDAMTVGGKMLFINNVARSTLCSVRVAWEDSNVDDVSWHRMKQFAETLSRFKRQRGLVDFSDMLTHYIEDGAPVGVRVAIVDEAQDLTPAQWRVVKIAFRDCERMYLAGDDDQAIYAWSGADVQHFMNLKVDEVKILPVSYRIPRRIFRIASNITDQIKDRYVKDYKPRDVSGQVTYCTEPSDVDLSEGSWYLLARNRCFLSTLEKECVRQGIPYTTRRGSSVDKDDVRAIRLYESARKGGTLTAKDASLVADRTGVLGSFSDGRRYTVSDVINGRQAEIWHDEFAGMSTAKVAYYLTALRRGEKLTRLPRVHVDTIHGVKGGEADNVLVMTDQTARTEAGTVRKPDDEARVFYVAVTRARENLYIMSPQTDRYYPL